MLVSGSVCTCRVLELLFAIAGMAEDKGSLGIVAELSWAFVVLSGFRV